MASTRLLLIAVLLINPLNGIGAHSNRGCMKCKRGTTKLKAVSMVFRHGDRSPAKTYPLDPYKNYEWPNGPGALSPKGAHQLYQSGLIKSTRYSSLFSIDCPDNGICTFDTHRISVISSAIQRCIDSAISFLDGFLRVDWPAQLIFVIPQDEDEMLAFPGKTCPRYLSPSTTLNNPEFNRIVDFNSHQGRQLLSTLENSTGEMFDSTLDLLFLEDTLSIYHDNGLELPEWTHSVWQRYLVPLSNAGFDLMSRTGFMKTRSGVLLKDTIDRLKGLEEGISNQNIILYSAHDITIAGMFEILGIRDQIGVARPLYGSSLNLELYENTAISNDYEVKVVYYSNHADDDPMDIDIPGCRAPCAFNDFVHRFSAALTRNFDETCDV